MTGRHGDQPVRRGGPALAEATGAAVLLHGRGARAEGMVQLARDLEVEGVAVLAPQAAERTWYPQSFMAPIEENEPWLSAALKRVASLLEDIEAAGIGRDRILVGGFSQGACLATEYVARNATRYGGVAALSGGLIGPEGTVFEYDGSLDGTPVFVGCSDVDPHIPLERVHETTAVLEELGAAVDERIYEGMGHTVSADERAHLAELFALLTR